MSEKSSNLEKIIVTNHIKIHGTKLNYEDNICTSLNPRKLHFHSNSDLEKSKCKFHYNCSVCWQRANPKHMKRIYSLASFTDIRISSPDVEITQWYQWKCSFEGTTRCKFAKLSHHVKFPLPPIISLSWEMFSPSSSCHVHTMAANWN